MLNVLCSTMMFWAVPCVACADEMRPLAEVAVKAAAPYAPARCAGLIQTGAMPKVRLHSGPPLTGGFSASNYLSGTDQPERLGQNRIIAMFNAMIPIPPSSNIQFIRIPPGANPISESI